MLLDAVLDKNIAEEKKLGIKLDQILYELEQLEKPQAAPNKDTGSIIVFLLTSFVSLVISFVMYRVFNV